jgi:hypothetical protein
MCALFPCDTQQVSWGKIIILTGFYGLQSPWRGVSPCLPYNFTSGSPLTWGMLHSSGITLHTIPFNSLFVALRAIHTCQKNFWLKTCCHCKKNVTKDKLIMSATSVLIFPDSPPWICWTSTDSDLVCEPLYVSSTSTMCKLFYHPHP